MRLFTSLASSSSLALLLLTLFSSHFTQGMEVATPEEVNMDPVRLKQIVTDLEKLVDQGKIPGAAFVVTRSGKLVYHGEVGYGDMQTFSAFKTNSICRMLSMSKPVSAVAFVKLLEQGLINFEDPVSKYLPEWSNMQVFLGSNPDGSIRTEPANRQITIKDLLTHTSGLSYGYGFGNMTAIDTMYPDNWRVPMMGMDEFSEKLAKVPLYFQPGTKWKYSYSFDLLGVVLQKVTGVSPDVWMKQHLFDPLKMEDTGFTVPGDKLNRYTSTYTVMGSGRLQFVFRPRLDFVAYRAPTFKSLGGGIVSTAKDYARLAQMLLNGGELDGVRILEAKSVDMMWRNYLPRELTPMDLNGWLSDAHTGCGLGFTIATGPEEIFDVNWAEKYGLGFTIATGPEEVFDVNWAEKSGDHRTGGIGWGGGAQTNFQANADTDTIVTYMIQRLGGEDYFQPIIVKGVYESIIGPSPRVSNGGFSTYTGVPSEAEKSFGNLAPATYRQQYSAWMGVGDQ